MRDEVTQVKSLFISAGHSNDDPGAAANGVTEADIVLEFRNMVGEELARRGVSFNQDGEGEVNMPLKRAAGIAAAHDVAVEFHCNAATPAATGCETLSKREAFPFAGRLCTAMADTMGIRNRGSKPENSGQHSRLAFVSDGGGVIVELFFLTNTDDLARYRANKQSLASAIADVLTDEVTEDYY